MDEQETPLDSGLEVVRRLQKGLRELRAENARLEREAAAGKMARGMLEAIAEDRESPDFSDESKWLGLKAFAREAANAYDKALGHGDT